MSERFNYFSVGKEWLNENSETHRKDGPSQVRNRGTKFWEVCKNRKSFRDRGGFPGIIYANGCKGYFRGLELIRYEKAL